MNKPTPQTKEYGSTLHLRLPSKIETAFKKNADKRFMKYTTYVRLYIETMVANHGDKLNVRK